MHSAAAREINDGIPRDLAEKSELIDLNNSLHTVFVLRKGKLFFCHQQLEYSSQRVADTTVHPIQ